MIDQKQKFYVKWNCKNIEWYTSKGYHFTKYNDKFEVKFEDIIPNSNMKIVANCDRCGKELIITYQHYIKNCQKYNEIVCKKCSSIRRSEQTLTERQEKMYEDVIDFCKKNKYILFTKKEKLLSNTSPIRYFCSVHGFKESRVTNFQQGKICYECGRMQAAKKRHQATLNERQDRYYSRLIEICKNEGYDLITPKSLIKRNSDYIEYKCPIHGVQSMRIGNMLSGKRCPMCNLEYLRTTFQLSSNEVKRRIESCGMKIINPEEYINQGTKNLRVICPECGEEFLSSLSVITNRNGQFCPSCSHSESKGERAIRHYLESNNIEFIQEKWFDDCRDEKPLPFDFYIPDYNMCIEFDGDQHFYDKGNFSTSFEYIQKHDEIKNKYCYDNNIELLRIPYWKYDKIDKILDYELNLHKDIV